MSIALAFLLVVWWRPYLRAFTIFVLFLMIAALPLLDRSPHYLALWLRRFYRHKVEDYLSSRPEIASSVRPEIASSVWRRCYLLSVVLLLFLIGV